MEITDYWTYKNKIIFSPYFDENIDKYYNIISKYNELIFSNYKSYNELIFSNYDNYYQTDPETSIKYNSQYYTSKFNKPIIIPKNITKIIFGYYFNHPVIIPENITDIIFDLFFNQPIIIPKNVTHLTFGLKFNQSIIIPESVTHLIFGYKFNQSIIIPKNVTHLTLGYHFDQPLNLSNIKYLELNFNNINLIENLPNSIEEIKFGNWFNLELNNLPNSVKKISFSKYSDYDKELNCLPEFVKYLELPINYKKKIKKLPLNIKTIKCDEEYEFINDYKNIEIQCYIYDYL